MRVLLACEESGRVRNQFIAQGHDAVSLDLLPSDTPGPHRQEPLTPGILAEGWDLIVAFPPCTHLSAIGARYWPRFREQGLQQAAETFVRMIWEAPVDRVVIENPVGYLNSHWRKPDQIINPWMFGDPWRKRTCLWLRGVPLLIPEQDCEPQGTDFWVQRQKRSGRVQGTETRDSLHESAGFVINSAADESRARSKTFPGIARAMAEQWGNV